MQISTLGAAAMGSDRRVAGHDVILIDIWKEAVEKINQGWASN